MSAKKITTSPIMKYNSPDNTGLAPIQMENIAANEANIAPKGCPEDMALTYLAGNRPTIPSKLPPKIADAAEKSNDQKSIFL